MNLTISLNILGLTWQFVKLSSMEQEAKLGEVKQGCKLLLHSQTLTIRSQKSWIKYVFFRLPSIVSNWILEVKSTISIQDLYIQFQI